MTETYCVRAPTCYRAKQIMTMAPDRPIIHDGVLIADKGIIQGITPYKRFKKEHLGHAQDLGPVIMTPGLINAHTHLELSHLQGQTRLGDGFETWVKSLIKLDLKGIETTTLCRVNKDLAAGGTICVGDVSGHSQRVMQDFLSASGLFFHLFLEQIGFQDKLPVAPVLPRDRNHRGPGELSLSGHALYSTHPRTLQKIKRLCREQGRPFSIHLAEHPGEVELLTTGQGPFSELLRKSLLPADFTPPGLGPVSYADRLGLLDRDTLAVHLVHVDPGEIELLAQRGVRGCLCPRSNALINVGQAPAETMLKAGLTLCLGTDSLCSNKDLNLWAEAEYFVRTLKMNISLQELVSLLTVNPAKTLKLDKQIGTLERGKRALFSLVPEELSAALPLT